MTPDGAKALPPCPFCGGPAIEGQLHPLKLRWQFIVCAKCKARTAASCDFERAKARWEKRTPDPATAMVLEAAKRWAYMDGSLRSTKELKEAVEALAGREKA